MTLQMPLPPGQRERHDFPRFGLWDFARRFPKQVDRIELQIIGEVEAPMTITDFAGLERVEQVCDFHCVTTWSYRQVRWSGFRFADAFDKIIAPRAGPSKDAQFVILRCQEGYRSSLPLSDLMAADVLLADRMNGKPLSIEHGAPLRLIAPAHYAYKSAKHLSRIEMQRDDKSYAPPLFRFMEHPRARVALEERGRGVPGLILRYLYRPLIRPTVSMFARATREHQP